jgi:hypothetical protein
VLVERSAARPEQLDTHRLKPRAHAVRAGHLKNVKNVKNVRTRRKETHERHL